jgi:hypothetical protein
MDSLLTLKADRGFDRFFRLGVERDFGKLRDVKTGRLIPSRRPGNVAAVRYLPPLTAILASSAI